MRLKLLLFAVAWVVAIALIVNDARVQETFQRANAALVCYWSDPGPPLAVPMPPDPQSINAKGSPPNAPVDFKTGAQRETQLPEFLKSVTTRPLRDIEITQSPTMLPLQTIDPNASLPSPFEEPSIPPTLAPTLGVLAVAPEVSVTPRPLLLSSPEVSTDAAVTISATTPAIPTELTVAPTLMTTDPLMFTVAPV